MGRKAKKAAKPKFEKYVVFTPEEDPKIYKLLDAIVERSFKTGLEAAHIRLAWANDCKADKDGQHCFGQARIPNKIDLQAHGIDVFVILNQNVWQSNQTQHEKILHAVLCSIVRDTDQKTGEVKEDAKGRPVFHIRKPNVRCFSENIRLYGPWMLEVAELVSDAAPKLVPPEKTLIHFMEGTEPPPARDPAADLADVRAAFEKVGKKLHDRYRGFALVNPAKVGKAVTREAAREAIDQIHALLECGNNGAAKTKTFALRDAGWLREEDALGAAPVAPAAAREPALAGVDARTASAGGA